MARRSNHEGHIRYRSDGRWEGAVMLAGRRHYASGRTRREASRKLASLRERHGAGTLRPPSRMTLTEFLADWLDAGRGDWKPKTYAGYESITRTYWNPELGHLRLQHLTAAHVSQALARWRNEERASGGTLLNVHRCLRRGLQVATYWGYLSTNPADAVEPPKARRRRPTLWSLGELRRFLAAAEGTDYGALWHLLIGTGCRIGEAMALDWTDFDLDVRSVSINKSVTFLHGERLVLPPKTDAGVRRVVLPEVTVEALRRWRALQARARLLGWTGVDSGRVGLHRG